MNKYDLEFIGLIEKIGLENLKKRLRVPRTIEIVCRKLGLEGYSPHTYKDIIKVCSVSQQRVEQIYQRARIIARAMVYYNYEYNVTKKQ